MGETYWQGRFKTGHGPCYPGQFTFGDTDGDGRLDFINESGIFLGHGDLLFGVLTVRFLDQKSHLALASGDINGDGLADVIIGSWGLRAYLSRPDGTLSGGELFASYEAGGRGSIKLIDIDADGDLDLLGESRQAAHLAWGNGDGTFEEVDCRDCFSLARMDIADLDADGHLDIVSPGPSWDPVTLERGPTVFYVNFVRGKHAIAERIQLPIPSASTGDPVGSASVADVDRDGALDLVTGLSAGKLAVLHGLGDGTFPRESVIEVPRPKAISAALVRDLDLDGWDDLVLAYAGELTVSVHWGLPEGLWDFGQPEELYTGVYPWRIETVTGLGRAFIRGDADDSGSVDLADALTILAQLFQGRDMICADASDADDSARVSIVDAVFLLNHLFLGGPPPTFPYPQPGGDTTWDERVPIHPGQPEDFGCSYESFHEEEFDACFPDDPEPPGGCPHPWKQILDLSPWDPLGFVEE